MDNNAKQLLARAQKLVEERERCLTDKMYLANEVLGYQFQPDVHQELFDQFLKMDASKSILMLDSVKDRLILWPRNHYKTTSLTVEIIQLVINFPDIEICIMRSTMKQSQKWLNEIAAHFSGEAAGSRFKELFPEFCGTRKQLKQTANKFVVPCGKKQHREPTVFIASFTSDTTGDHYDVGFFDDLVTKDNFQNPTQLAKVITGFWAITPQVKPGGYRYVSGTRYANGDLYDEIIRKNTNKNWKISVKDCWTDDQKGVRFPMRVVKFPNGVEEPVGFTRELLLQIQETDPGMFSSQYLNRPVSESYQSFTEDQMTSALVDPEQHTNLSTPVIFVDLASGQGPKADDCVIAVGKIDLKSNIYVVDARGGKWSPEQFAMNVIDMTVKHLPLKVMFENTHSTDYFISQLRMIATEKGIHIPVDKLKVDNKPDAKMIRVKGLASLLTRGRLRFFKGLSCWDKMKKQFINFTGDRHVHDDYPDTVALMANYFIGSAPPPPPAESNYMVALLERAHAFQEHQRMLQNSQEPQDEGGGMGSDFAC